MIKQILAVTLVLAVWLHAASPAHAISLIRDAEIEQALKQLARPVLRAAGLGPNRVRILVIHDSSLNAFVVDSRHIFVHSIGFALATAAAIKGEGEAAIGLATGTASSAQRVFFSHTRAEEASADQSGLRYLAQAGIDPSAMSDVMELFRGQEALRPGRQDPYAITHPLTRDRLRAIKGYVAGYKDNSKPTPAASVYWFNRMDAKLQGFLRKPSYVLRRKSAKGNGETAILRRAIAYHRKPDTKRALAEMSKLLKLRPKDAYYHELRGQILLESRRPKEAIAAYKIALSLAKGEALILAGLGNAYLAIEGQSAAQEAVKVLQTARGRDPGDPNMLRGLAVAHARLGQNGLASVATAERYAILGRFKDAQTHAKRALGILPRGSSGWLRAQDVADTAARVTKR